MDPVGLSALLEALKARVTSVLKFEVAVVTRCRFYGLPAAQNATVVVECATWLPETREPEKKTCESRHRAGQV